MIVFRKRYFLLTLFLLALYNAQAQKVNMSFTVSMEKPATQYYHIVLQCVRLNGPQQDLKMSAWTPGYYQLLDYAKSVEHFTAAGANGEKLGWENLTANTFRVHNNDQQSITVSYDVKASKAFVANAYLDDTRAYIVPGALFFYLEEELHNPVTITVQPYPGWKNQVATGLDTVAGKPNTFFADNFDVLYDSPFLMGDLEELTPFFVDGKAHHFIGYKLGEFDREQFTSDLKKIVEAGIAIIGDVPYSHYTFLAIGPGRGGIEHLNSTSLSFSNGEGFDSPEGKKRLYSFIAHEYFHHYNVKRIRPIELGPFDYSKENKTNMLWVAEGFTVYYEYLMLKRAGLTTDQDVFNEFQSNIMAYENKPGHLFQSATQASYDTWSDGPFGRTGDEVNKTISYYDKGPVLGLMLDFKIRHETNNKKSLDDVMRLLYNKYYQLQKRGYSEAEFRTECEKMAGTSLEEVFDYASTVKAVNYLKYFAYGGLAIDTVPKELPGAWLGITVKEKDNHVLVTGVDWNSPAWNAGIRIHDTLEEIDGIKASREVLNKLLKTHDAGYLAKIVINKPTGIKETAIQLSTKFEKKFTIEPLPNPTPLQKDIYTDWLKTNAK